MRLGVQLANCHEPHEINRCCGRSAHTIRTGAEYCVAQWCWTESTAGRRVETYVLANARVRIIGVSWDAVYRAHVIALARKHL